MVDQLGQKSSLFIAFNRIDPSCIQRADCSDRCVHCVMDCLSFSRNVYFSLCSDHMETGRRTKS